MMARQTQSATKQITRRTASAAWMDEKIAASDVNERRESEMEASAIGGCDQEAYGFETAVVQGQTGDEAFGWLPQVDQATGRAYFIHSHTGEVTWSLDSEPAKPQTNPWTMHERYADPCNPFYTHLVSLPTGITPCQPQAPSLESWRGGYNQFPMQASNASQCEASADEDAKSVEHRVLPCTWENSEHGPPFLSPFPVVIIQPVWKEERPPLDAYVAISSHEPWWNPATPPQQHSESTPLREFVTSYTLPEYAAPTPAEAYCKSLPAPYPASYHAPAHHQPPVKEPVFKEHNRRGYHMRQARKLLKQLSLQAENTTSPPQPSHPDQGRIDHGSHHNQSSAIRVN